MAISLATYGRNAASVTARAADFTTGVGSTPDFNGGLNLGASNAPGIGINTGGFDPKTDDWTTLDQAATGRTPQVSQHIGGSGYTVDGTGDTDTDDIRCVVAQLDDDTPDYLDPAHFVVADQTALPNASPLASDATLVNRTGTTIVAGQRLWVTKPAT